MIVDDYSDLVGEYGTRTAVPMARHSGDTIVRGLRQPGGWTATTVTIAAIFPATREQQEAVPAGLRQGGMIVIYTVDELRTVQDAGSRGDVIEYNGGLWQVVARNDWRMGRFVESFATNMNRNETTVAAFVAAGGSP